MARHKLSDSKLKGLVKPGIYGDGDGLYLRLQSSGSRSWVFVWKRFGARREIGLGPYGKGSAHVGLAAARLKAQEAREIVGAGRDPKSEMAERKSAKRAMTLGDVADEYVDTMKSKWRDKNALALGAHRHRLHQDNSPYPSRCDQCGRRSARIEAALAREARNSR